MTEENKIKENFLFFLKALTVSSFLVLAMEAIELVLKLNYQLSYAPAIETIKLAGLFLLVLFLFSALSSAILALLSKALGTELLKGMIETLCTSVIFLTWGPALYLMIVTRDFPRTMKAFWLGDYGVIPGLIPILIVVAVVILRIIFKKRFAGEFNGLVRLLWKPVAVVVVAAFLWVSATTLFSAPFDAKSTRLAAMGDKKETPNIILISFDALSARDMSLYGYHLKTTPTWEALAKESYVFDRAHSSSNKTAPSIVSILTGKHPWTHGVFTEGVDRVQKAEKNENLAALLTDHYTSAIVSTNQVFPPFIGMGGEFDHVRWTDHSDSKLVNALSSFIKMTLKTDPSPLMMPIIRHPLFIDAEISKLYDHRAETFDKAEKLLREIDGRPFFLWLHIWPPHLPYFPPRPFLGSYLPFTDKIERSFETIPVGGYPPSMQPLVDKLRLRYDESVLFSDYKLFGFLDFLKSSGLFDNSIIIATSDHGEIFEKGWNAHHSPYLAQGELHVPLLIHLPGQKEARLIHARAEGVDLAPTILDLLGKATPRWMEGESLVPYMKGEKIKTEKAKFAFTHFDRHTIPELGDESLEKIAVYRGDYKLIFDLATKSASLYNTTLDKDEERDISKENIAIVRELWNDLKANVKTREISK